jgi:hypothetical protein
VITVAGYAWRTPLGGTIDGVMQRLLAGDRAAAPNRRFPIDGYELRTAAVVAEDPAPNPHARFLRRMGQLAREAALECCPRVENIGLFFGYGGLRAHWNDLMPGLAEQRDDFAGSWERGLKLFHPFWMLQNLSNNAHAIVAKDLNARADGVTFGGANAGAQALVGAIRSLQSGACDLACVTAYDTLLEPETLVVLGARQSEIVPGEAAAAIVLQRDGDGPTLEARDAADGSPDRPSPSTVEKILRGWEDPVGGFDEAFGELGAATSVVQAIALCERKKRGLGGNVAVAVGAPGLAGAVRIS